MKVNGIILKKKKKNIELNSIDEVLILEDRIRKNVGRVDIEDDVYEQILQKVSEVENA